MILDPTAPPRTDHAPRRWLPLLLGFAVLAGVVVIATHFSEEEESVRLARESEPGWFAAALALQAGTYLAQGEIWRMIGRLAGTPLALPFVYKLALAKLFVDQAIPSAGVSGSVVIAQALERGALPRAAVLAGIVVNTTSFFIAYVAALTAALIILLLREQASSAIVTATVLFMIVSTGLTTGMLALSGKDMTQRRNWPLRARLIQNTLQIMKDADPLMVRNTRLQAAASGYQLLTFLLDAATLWTLIRSLGAKAHMDHVFASFMIANLVRTVSFIPGGLGTFEGTAVLMLRMGGVSVGTGLATVLLFRGLSFFLPMAPGLWFSRTLNRQHRRI